MSRKTVFHAVVGSANYNLMNKNSDMDYKTFEMPDFEDLYHGQKYIKSKASTSNTEDTEVHDIRRLPELLWKSNVNFIETLFSTDIFIPDDAPEQIYEIMNMRDRIAKMNLPYLYDACVGMHYERMKKVEKSINKDGTYDYKNAYQSIRILSFLVRFYVFNWGFKEAIWYLDIYAKDMLMRIKNGEVSYDDFLNIRRSYRNDVNSIKSFYKEEKPDEDTKNELERLVFNMVKESVLGIVSHN